MTLEILSNAQMAEADKLAIAGGKPGFSLMEAAGAAVADAVLNRFVLRPVVVLCGPGNNGGDGFIAARLLKNAGRKVRVACLVPLNALKGDAARAVGVWNDQVRSFDGFTIAPDELVVDAVFGTGFSGKIDGAVAALFTKIREQKNEVLAVDIPSGVNGSTGAADPLALKASQTVTFFRRKLGHVLQPGAALCGDILTADIGIPDTVLAQTGISAKRNEPALWRAQLPTKTAGGHKYDYGHALVYGGRRLTGAAGLAAQAAMRMGAGLCTIAGHPDAADVYQTAQPHVMFEPCKKPGRLGRSLKDERRNAVLIGPGAGTDDGGGLRRAVMDACGGGARACVLDADALTVFQGRQASLYGALTERCVLTPHEGEFARVFPDIEGTKTARAEAAARLSGAAVLLKGADTVIAAPRGLPVVNVNAPPQLATGGAGDVLAGMILGLLAQGAPPFAAACAAAWIHGEAARRFGPGLVAPDIIELIPGVLRDAV